jgi:two-component system chemotaxis sensor kinase CheA
MQIDVSRFHAAFFEEAAEHLATMEESLLALEQSPAEQELVHTIFRCAHSLKGASGSFGFPAIAAFTHALEGLLDRMRDGSVPVTAERINPVPQRRTGPRRVGSGPGSTGRAAGGSGE